MGTIRTDMSPYAAKFDGEDSYTVIDTRYRIRENPDPWQRENEPPRGNYVVEVQKYSGFYYYQAEVPTMRDALKYIADDVTSPVFIPSKTGGDLICRWCHEFRFDLYAEPRRTCNLCDPIIRGGMG